MYTWLNKDEYDSYVDLEAEKVSDPFTRPIEANKTLDRIDDEGSKTWIKKMDMLANSQCMETFMDKWYE